MARTLAIVVLAVMCAGCALVEREPDPRSRGWVIPDPEQPVWHRLLVGTRWVNNPYEVPGAWDKQLHHRDREAQK